MGMTLSRFAKSVLYLVGTAVLLLISSLFQISMRSEGGLEQTYFRSDLYLFVLAAVLLGIGVYSYLSYTRLHKEHRADSLFLFCTGGVLMVLVITVILVYGGLDDNFIESWYTAANFNVLILSALPVPFLVRAFFLALRTENAGGRKGLLIACGALVVVMAILVATGGLMKLQDYEDVPQENLTSEYEDQPGTAWV